MSFFSAKAKVQNPDAFYGVITNAIKNAAGDADLVNTILQNAQHSLGESILDLFKKGELVSAFKALADEIIMVSGHQVKEAALLLVKQLEASAITASASIIDKASDKAEQIITKTIEDIFLQVNDVSLRLINAAFEKGIVSAKEICSFVKEDLRELIVYGGEQVNKLLGTVAAATGKELLTELFKLLEGSSEEIINHTLVPAIITCTKKMGSEVKQIIEVCSQHLDKQLHDIISQAFEELKTFTTDEFSQVQAKLINKLAGNMHSLVEHFTSNLEAITIHSINQGGEVAWDMLEKLAQKMTNSKSAGDFIAEHSVKVALENFLITKEAEYGTLLHQKFKIEPEDEKKITEFLSEVVKRALDSNYILPKKFSSTTYSYGFVCYFTGKIAITIEKILLEAVMPKSLALANLSLEETKRLKSLVADDCEKIKNLKLKGIEHKQILFTRDEVVKVQAKLSQIKDTGSLSEKLIKANSSFAYDKSKMLPGKGYMETYSYNLIYDRIKSSLSSKYVYSALNDAIYNAYAGFERIQRGAAIFETSDREHSLGRYITQRLLGYQEEIKILKNHVLALTNKNQQQAELLVKLGFDNSQQQQEIAKLSLENTKQKQEMVSLTLEYEALHKQMAQLLTSTKENLCETLSLIPKVTIRFENGRLSYYKNSLKMHELDLTTAFSENAQLAINNSACIVWDNHTIFYFRITEDKLQKSRNNFKLEEQTIEQAVMLDEKSIIVALADGKVRYWQYNEADNKPAKSKQWLKLFKEAPATTSSALDTLKLSEKLVTIDQELDSIKKIVS